MHNLCFSYITLMRIFYSYREFNIIKALASKQWSLDLHDCLSIGILERKAGIDEGTVLQQKYCSLLL